MGNEIYRKQQTVKVIADTTDYAGDLGTRTDQIDLTSLADGASRQSAKVDLAISGAYLAQEYDVYAAIEMAVAPASGATIDFYAGFSPSATAATANPGGCSGSDAAYTGTAGDSMDDSLKQLTFIGSMVLTSDATTVVQFQHIGTIVAVQRYACFVVDNNGGQALVADAAEMGILLVPVTHEVQ